jgi:putative ABC transport system permease protein
VYVATPQLLATYGITAGQIAPGTDILTIRPGMANLPDMELTWGDYGVQQGPGGFTHKDSVLPSCTLSDDCLTSPRMQTLSVLLQTHLAGWLVQAPAPLTAAQVNVARQFALTYGATAETESASLGPGEFADGATALGIVIALGVLATTVGLIRAESAPDLCTLTATGASTTTRRMITPATAAALGLFGAILGMAGAVIAGLAWARSNLSVMFGDVPLTDVLILVPGLPLIAAAAGWLLADREPKVIARQPLD